AVEDDDLVTARDERFDERRSDQAGAAEDEHVERLRGLGRLRRGFRRVLGGGRARGEQRAGGQGHLEELATIVAHGRWTFAGDGGHPARIDVATLVRGLFPCSGLTGRATCSTDERAPRKRR